jgi:DNA-binding beta-propeller fold protein YncE
MRPALWLFLPGAAVVIAPTKDPMEKNTSPILGFTLARSLALLSAVAFMLKPAHAQIYVADQATETVKEYSASTGTQITGGSFTTIAPGSGANLTAMALSGNSLYVADTYNETVKAYNATTGGSNLVAGFATISEAGNGPDATGPTALAVSGSTLWVANDSSETVKSYSATAGGSAVLSISSPGALGVGPCALALSSTALYVANNSSNTVEEYNPTTGNQVGGFSITLANGDIPSSLALSSDGTELFVGILTNSSPYGEVLEYSASSGGSPIGGFSIITPQPSSLAVVGSILYVGDSSNLDVKEYSASSGGSPLNGFNISVDGPVGLAVVVPEPSSAVLLLCSAVPLLLLRRRRTAVSAWPF